MWPKIKLLGQLNRTGALGECKAPLRIMFLHFTVTISLLKMPKLAL